jgi:hypothetical protein
MPSDKPTYHPQASTEPVVFIGYLLEVLLYDALFYEFLVHILNIDQAGPDNGWILWNVAYGHAFRCVRSCPDAPGQLMISMS